MCKKEKKKKKNVALTACGCICNARLVGSGRFLYCKPGTIRRVETRVLTVEHQTRVLSLFIVCAHIL